jgi:hypothetical protein
MAVTPLCAGIWLIVDQQQSYARNETLNLAIYGLLLWTVIGTVAWGVAIKQFERLRSA